MSSLVPNPAPDFTATACMPDNSFKEDFKLSDYRGKYVVLFFYPLDFTFVCPSEIIAFDTKLEEFKSKYGPSLGFHGAAVVAGGREARWETVRNALAEMPPECTHIAVHDAARPAVSKELLDRLFEAARSLSAVVPAVRVTATVKRLSAERIDVANREGDALADAILGEAGRPSLSANVITETVDRKGLAEVQTPQIFEAALLRRAYAQDDLSGATDDASLVERLGEPVHAVEGDVMNLKVTTPGDLKLVRAILGVRAPAERPAHKRF